MFPDDENASVSGVVTADGLFDGSVSTATDDYYIEPVSRYFTPDTDTSPHFHSIVYRTSDVLDPGVGAPCASQLFHEKLNGVPKDTLFEKVSKRLHEVKRKSKKSRKSTRSEDSKKHAKSEEGPFVLEDSWKSDSSSNRANRLRRWLLEAEAKQPLDDNNYWTHGRPRLPLNPPYDQPIDEEVDMMVNRTYTDVSGLIFRNVNKRATIDPKKTTCMLYLQADHQFFQKYGTEEACIEVMTRHVQRVNSIYRNTGEFLF